MVSVSKGFTSLLEVRHDLYMKQKRKEEFLSWPRFSGHRHSELTVTMIKLVPTAVIFMVIIKIMIMTITNNSNDNENI